jgi:copper chaperone
MGHLLSLVLALFSSSSNWKVNSPLTFQQVEAPSNVHSLETRMKLYVPEMSCGHCKSSIGTAIAGLDGAATVEFDMDARKITVATDRTSAEVIDALDVIGFDAEVAD